MANYTGTTAYSSFTLEASGVASVTYSKDNSLVYVARRDGKIDVFNVASHSLVTTWNVGTSLGGISLSEDGSFLLATEANTPSNSGIVHRVSTATGAVQNFTAGSQFWDVEVVDAHYAILTGPTAMQLNLDTDAFEVLNGAIYYSGWGSVLTEDNHLTLIAEPGISNGPLFLYDDRTGSVVASGSTYDTPNTGFNWGSQAVSEKAGQVAQFIYYSSLNIYDLNLDFVRTVSLSGRADGVAYDPEGNYAFVYLIDSGVLAKYRASDWSLVDQFSVGTSEWHNNIGYGDQIHVSADGTYITLADNSSVGKLQLIDLSARNETFVGTVGADNFTGLDGNDTYYINHAGDTIIETYANGNDLALLSVSYALAANVERATVNVTTGLTVTGNELANMLTGNVGDDTLDGGLGKDEVHGGDGNDTLYANDAADFVAGEIYDGGAGIDRLLIDIVTPGIGWIDLTSVALTGIERLERTPFAVPTVQLTRSQLTGFQYVEGAIAIADGGAVSMSGITIGENHGFILSASGNIFDLSGALRPGGVTSGFSVSGQGGNDSITGGASDDIFNGGGGVDTLNGGAGKDRLHGNEGDDQLFGGSHNDMLWGDNGNDWLDGGTGDDILEGGDNDDTYVVDSVGDTILEGATATSGNDTVRTALASYTLGANLENLTFTGVGPFTGTGNGLANILTGGAGNDTLYGLAGDDWLDGGAGADNMQGGANDDTYVVDNAGDIVTEAAAAGNDKVRTALGSYTLGANVEQLLYTGTGAFTGTGNGDANVIDTRGASGNDTLRGMAGADTLYAGAGNDSLDGGTGIDAMFGGAGDDVYTVDDAGDTATELAGEGTDTVRSSVSYTLGANVENLTLTGGAASSGTGNALDNILIGNGSANVLDGGAGADRMEGGGGDDTYRVDNAGDLVIETGTGIDKVIASVSYVLRAGSAVETVTTDDDAGTAAINLTGNEFANRLVGNAGANTLHGGAGDDRLEGLGGADTLWGDAGKDLLMGGDGNDIYVVTDLLDTVVETIGGGNDTVSLSLTGDGVFTLANYVEGLTVVGAGIEAHGSSQDNKIVNSGTGNSLYGEGGNDTLIGNANVDLLHGGTGSDRITGAGGNDRLWGDGNNDVFVFATGSGADEIVDFLHGSDRIDLSGYGISSFAQVQAMMSQSGANTLIDLGGGNSITLDNVIVTQLDAADFGLPTPGTAPASFAATNTGDTHNLVTTMFLDTNSLGV